MTKKARTIFALAFLLAVPLAHACGQTSRPREFTKHRKVPETLSVAQGRAALDRTLAWLVKTQNEDGSWAHGVIVGLLDSGYSVASFYDWQYAANAIACLALLQAPETPARRRTLEKGLHWLCQSRVPERGSDWDNDTVWAALYGSTLCLEASADPRFRKTPLADALRQRGKKLILNLKRNQVPTGGWGYYDNKPYTRRPKWATSFSTALILPTIREALERGWLVDRRILKRAQIYVQRAGLPNGAYQYDMRPIPRSPAGESIDTVKGSLGRIQVCNWGLRASGRTDLVSLDRIRRGLRDFFRFHRFLDVARMRPVPHEAYYANAGYFYYFGHYYGALATQLLPIREREEWHARMRAQIVKTQRKDGSFCDFLGQGYMVVADTGFAALTLNLGLDQLPPVPKKKLPR